ncbi:MAG TPA: DUF305 domain-containing protein [Ilumatobacter sp.]|nr:DUF305 domain-containing protein [Ilumatobacter sp.]
MKIKSLAVIAVATSLTVAACGGDDDSSSPTEPATVDSAGGDVAAATFNDADVEFAQGMIPHHEQAVEMADIALDPTVGAGVEVTDLATRIQGAQDPEIELMTEWLTGWGQPVQMDMSGGHNMEDMDGMMSAEEMDMLGAATGAEFDRMWMEMMIAHHEGAISMAEAVQAEGTNPDVIALAATIITAQQAEIDEMRTLLGS